MKVYKPTSPSRRGMTSPDYSVLTKVAPLKSLVFSKHRKVGRDGGTISVRHKGGGVKKLYRAIDFKRDKLDVAGHVTTLEYDPYRTSFIALVTYQDGEKRYILAPNGLKVGDKVLSSRQEIESLPGSALPLKYIPVGNQVYNIELKLGKGGQIARSAGSAATIVSRDAGYVQLKMPSSEIRLVSEECMAVVGQPSNIEWSLVTIGKAGRSRKMGIRPSVRGSAMNPVDHPHGGGEGRAPIGLKYPKTPWGKNARGVKTRDTKKPSQQFIISRRKK